MTSTPSKKAYIWVSGFIFLEMNWIFLDLINEMRFRLTTLSPTDDASNCSVTIVLFPVLVWTPVSLTSLRVSLRTVVVVSDMNCPPVKLPFPRSPLSPHLPPLVVLSVLSLVFWVTSWPVQFVSQEFHIVGENPVCGSTFKVLLAVARVSA